MSENRVGISSESRDLKKTGRGFKINRFPSASPTTKSNSSPLQSPLSPFSSPSPRSTISQSPQILNEGKKESTPPLPTNPKHPHKYEKNVSPHTSHDLLLPSHSPPIQSPTHAILSKSSPQNPSTASPVPLGNSLSFSPHHPSIPSLDSPLSPRSSEWNDIRQRLKIKKRAKSFAVQHESSPSSSSSSSRSVPLLEKSPRVTSPLSPDHDDGLDQNMENWDLHDVCRFLKSLGMGQYQKVKCFLCQSSISIFLTAYCCSISKRMKYTVTSYLFWMTTILLCL